MNLLAYVHEEMEEEHSMEEGHSMEEKHSMEEGRKPAFTVRLGLLPRVETTVCIDLNWMDAGELFPEALPGTLKIVCHGRRVSREELSEIVLSSMPAFHDVKLRISDMMLTDTYPEQTLPDRKLVDRFGQSAWKEWTGKVKSDADLKRLPLRELVCLGRLEGKEAERRHRLFLQMQTGRQMVAHGSGGLRLFQHGAGLRRPGRRLPHRRRGELAGVAAGAG